MDRASTWLLSHKRNVYSQCGEDGIIEKILEILPDNDNWCVEFGAWDGLFLSNARNLIENKKYSSVLIEADKKKFRDLQMNYVKYNNVITINKLVGLTEKDNLDIILNTTRVPIDFDFLSIDIDGNDYHVWEVVSKYRPKLVVIEFNPTVPTHIRFVQPASQSVNQGASLLSLVELGKKKDYELVAVLPFNAFFVKKEFFPLFNIISNSPEALRDDCSFVTYLFSGFDGKIFLHGSCMLPWHGIRLKESRIQQLPRFLQKYPGRYSKFHMALFIIYYLMVQPKMAIQRLTEIFKKISLGKICNFFSNKE